MAKTFDKSGDGGSLAMKRLLFKPSRQGKLLNHCKTGRLGHDVLWWHIVVDLQPNKLDPIWQMQEAELYVVFDIMYVREVACDFFHKIYDVKMFVVSSFRPFVASRLTLMEFQLVLWVAVNGSVDTNGRKTDQQVLAIHTNTHMLVHSKHTYASCCKLFCYIHISCAKIAGLCVGSGSLLGTCQPCSSGRPADDTRRYRLVHACAVFTACCLPVRTKFMFICIHEYLICYVFALVVIFIYWLFVVF